LILNKSLREKHGADEGRWELKKRATDFEREFSGLFEVCDEGEALSSKEN
jgi:hypothetical protein